MAKTQNSRRLRPVHSSVTCEGFLGVLHPDSAHDSIHFSCIAWLLVGHVPGQYPGEHNTDRVSTSDDHASAGSLNPSDVEPLPDLASGRQKRRRGKSPQHTVDESTVQRPIPVTIDSPNPDAGESP